MADNKFEKSLGELEKIVETLEKGETTLDESIELFEKGMKISKACRENLDNVKQKKYIKLHTVICIIHFYSKHDLVMEV